MSVGRIILFLMLSAGVNNLTQKYSETVYISSSKLPKHVRESLSELLIVVGRNIINKHLCELRSGFTISLIVNGCVVSLVRKLW